MFLFASGCSQKAQEVKDNKVEETKQTIVDKSAEVKENLTNKSGAIEENVKEDVKNRTATLKENITKDNAVQEVESIIKK